MTILNRWFEEVWNRGNEATIDELLRPDTTIHGLKGLDGKDVEGPEAFKAFYHGFRATLSDIHVEVEATVTEGPLTVARCMVTARHTGDVPGKPAKGNPLKFSGMAMVRVQDGKFAEVWNNFDFMTMLQQMD